jgi:hypothetical protein
MTATNRHVDEEVKTRINPAEHLLPTNFLPFRPVFLPAIQTPRNSIIDIPDLVLNMRVNMATYINEYTFTLRVSKNRVLRGHLNLRRDKKSRIHNKKNKTPWP